MNGKAKDVTGAIPGGFNCLDPRIVRPIHAPRDPEYVDTIVRSMSENGWLGRPLLVVPAVSGIYKYQALTGSHRLAAAKRVMLKTIPTLVVDGPALDIILKSRYFPPYPPGIAQDLFGAGESWLGRFILMDQLADEMDEPWSEDSLDILRDLGHEDMVEIMSVKKWPCEEGRTRRS